jgi:hypothetical protein
MAQKRATRSSQRRLHVRETSGHLANEISEILTLDARALRQKWAKLYSAEPSPLIDDSLIIRVITYRLQERACGGLKPAAHRVLDRILEDSSGAGIENLPKPRTGAGTVLIREWGGSHHRVIVLDHDVVYRGRRYKSLSEVARVITGTRWSGPRFFGLKRRARGVGHG